MMIFEEKDRVEEIISNHGKDKSHAIAIMQEIQEEYRYLPEHILEYVSESLNISLSKLYGIATFYEFFSLEPKGEYVIKICDGTACHVRKSIPILKALQEELKLSDEKQTTDDLLFTLETVSCLGACGLAPVLTINEKVYGSMTPESTVAVLREIKEGI